MVPRRRPDDRGRIGRVEPRAGGSRVWQIAAVVVVAVMTGAVGTIVAQRVRHQDERFVSAA
jgi:hypothetical protein